MRTFAMLVLLAATASAATSPIRPTTTNNDDSCDLALQPAATLLLPYFEVDFASPQTTARRTYFEIINTSPLPQIARVTLWTDWGYPGFTFPLFLTGYDAQLVNLYDIFTRAVIAPGVTPGTGGTSSQTPVPENQYPGTQPAPNDANPNFIGDVKTSCNHLPGIFDPANLLSPATMARQQQILTEAIGMLGARIIGAHAKDVVESGYSAPGAGLMDYHLVFRLLTRIAPVPLIAQDVEESDAPRVHDQLVRWNEEATAGAAS